MTLDEAIQHCEEVAESKRKQVENGDWEKGSSTERDCIVCAEEHRQLAEWLKELKAYKEQDSVAISNLAMCHILNHEVKWINERMTREGVGRMNESEKERLIKKDIASIENRVRHAFNQGYEMGVKVSRSENPNTCGDAISRQAVLNAMYELCNTGETLKENPWRDNPHIDAVVEAIEELPSVTPQQRMGQWIEHFDEIGKWYECDQCHTDWGGPVNFCPNCGAKMEVSGCTKNI